MISGPQGALRLSEPTINQPAPPSSPTGPERMKRWLINELADARSSSALALGHRTENLHHLAVFFWPKAVRLTGGVPEKSQAFQA